MYACLTPKMLTSLFGRMIQSITLQYVLSITVIQCTHFFKPKNSLMYRYSWDTRGRFIKDFRFNTI